MSELAASSVTEYENQLRAVDEALKHASGEQEVELLDLKYKLLEVISLLQGDQSEEPRKSTCNENADPSIEDEFTKFQMEIKALAGDSTDEEGDGESSNSSSSHKSEEADGPSARGELDQELMQIISSLEGSKCRAPFRLMSGEQGHYNALIIAADYDPSTMQSLEDIEVKVMFCNPMCDRMKPCSFFLDGHCKFSDEKCRYSHGHRVSFPDLQEFILPDLRNLRIDSKCLAKCSDGLWQKATVEKCLDNQRYSVKFDKSGRSDTLEAQCIFPLDSHIQSDHEDTGDEDSCSSSDYGSPNPHQSNASDVDSAAVISSPLGAAVVWEQHTKGIGSKLMEKMGHVWGQGLGKNSDGRLEPVEAVILPAGKSLDKCMEMRERCDQKGPVSIETRLALEQDKEEQRAKKVKTDVPPIKKGTVFDFLNNRIAKVKDDSHTLVSGKNFQTDCDGKADNRDLNIQIFSVGEDIRKAKRELSRLQQSLQRNSNRNESTRVHVQKKIAAQNDLLRNLQAKEMKLNKDIKTQNSQKKLAVF